MKKYILCFLFLAGFTASTFSQINAVNWTLNDCNGNSHTLYNYLDSQQVVVMEFSMGCASCTNAASRLMDLKAEYDVSHPGKVKFFFMDYWTGNTCTDVNATPITHGFDASFAGCETQKDDYYPSLEPMPAVIVAAGNYHTVIFQHHTWLHSDTLAIQQAITQFFNTVGTEPVNDLSAQVTVYPNPAADYLMLNLPGNIIPETVSLYDLAGRLIRTQGVSSSSAGTVSISVEGLMSGTYIVEIRDKEAVIRKTFQVL